MPLKKRIAISGLLTIVYSILSVMLLLYGREFRFISSNVVDFFVAPAVIIGLGVKSNLLASGLLLLLYFLIWLLLFTVITILKLLKKYLSNSL